MGNAGQSNYAASKGAVEAFTNYNRPAGSVAVFPLIKYVEILNIGRVFEGLHFGLAPEAIQSMMIGL